MTLNDIKKEVAHLGFESESAIDGSIEGATRRALSTIYTEHGARGTGRLYQSSPIPRRYIPAIAHTGKEEEVISLVWSSYAFVVSGVGAFQVSDSGGNVRYEEFDTYNGYVHGKVIGAGVIRFKGDFRYTVYDLCIYSEAFADGEAPPRYGKMREYDLKDVFPDFLCAITAPKTADGEMIKNSSITGRRLLLPYDYTGEVLVEYRKSAPAVSINTPDLDLDIPDELKDLVPLLVAAYVWLDDDADKAQYYMSLYRDGMSAVKLYTRRCIDTEFDDTTRWA